MKRPKNASNKRMSGFNLTERHFEMIADLMESGRYMNNSDIVRRAIELFYLENHEEMPEYKIQRLKKEEEKREQATREDKFATMPREEYCVKVLHGFPHEETCFLPPYGTTSKPLNEIRSLTGSTIDFFITQVPLLAMTELYEEGRVHEKARKALEKQLDGIKLDSAEYWELVDSAKSLLAQDLSALRSKTPKQKSTEEVEKELDDEIKKLQK